MWLKSLYGSPTLSTDIPDIFDMTNNTSLYNVDSLV